MADDGAPNPNPPDDGTLNPHPVAANKDKVAQVPNPEDLYGPQQWEKIKSLKRAKEIIAPFWSSATQRAINDEDRAYNERVNKAMVQCFLEWGRLDVEVNKDLAQNGRANATHFILAHNHDHAPGGITDHQAIQRKKAHFTIARARFQCRIHDRAAIREGCQKWVDTFLDRLPGYAFDAQSIAYLRAVAGRR